jgi:hypothetical protein
MPAETAGIEHALAALRESLLAHGAKPVAAGALLIEDTEAAVERMLAAWDESWPERAGMEHLLRAACMEGR